MATLLREFGTTKCLICAKAMNPMNSFMGHFQFGPFQFPVWSALWFFQGCFSSWVTVLTNWDSLSLRTDFCLMNLERPFSPGVLASGCYKLRTGDSPGLITTSCFCYQLIRPSRCESGETIENCVASWVCGAIHWKSFECQGRLFGKHLFGLEISRSSVNLPGLSLHLMG